MKKPKAQSDRETVRPEDRETGTFEHEVITRRNLAATAQALADARTAVTQFEARTAAPQARRKCAALAQRLQLDLAILIDQLIIGPQIQLQTPDLLHQVCHHFQIPRQALLGRTRLQHICWARHIAMFLLREQGFSYPEIGRTFRLTRYAAHHGCRQIENAIATRDPRAHSLDQLRQLKVESCALNVASSLLSAFCFLLSALFP